MSSKTLKKPQKGNGKQSIPRSRFQTSRRGNGSQCIQKSDLSYYLNGMIRTLKAIPTGTVTDVVKLEALTLATSAIVGDMVKRFDLRGVKF